MNALLLNLPDLTPTSVSEGQVLSAIKQSLKTVGSKNQWVMAQYYVHLLYTVSKRYNNINRQVQTTGDAHSGMISLSDVT